MYGKIEDFKIDDVIVSKEDLGNVSGHTTSNTASHWIVCKDKLKKLSFSSVSPNPIYKEFDDGLYIKLFSLTEENL